ncbi:MAG: hypothetical protein H6721_13400 [Sandaracinus sp.]|nr:hypothetical protein [Sandaracinus sp.]
MGTSRGLVWLLFALGCASSPEARPTEAEEPLVPPPVELITHTSPRRLPASESLALPFSYPRSRSLAVPASGRRCVGAVTRIASQAARVLARLADAGTEIAHARLEREWARVRARRERTYEGCIRVLGGAAREGDVDLVLALLHLDRAHWLEEESWPGGFLSAPGEAPHGEGALAELGRAVTAAERCVGSPRRPEHASVCAAVSGYVHRARHDPDASRPHLEAALPAAEGLLASALHAWLAEDAFAAGRSEDAERHAAAVRCEGGARDDVVCGTALRIRAALAFERDACDETTARWEECRTTCATQDALRRLASSCSPSSPAPRLDDQLVDAIGKCTYTRVTRAETFAIELAGTTGAPTLRPDPPRPDLEGLVHCVRDRMHLDGGGEPLVGRIEVTPIDP